MQKSDIHKAACDLVKQSNIDREGPDGYVIPLAIVEQLSDDIRFDELLQILETSDEQDDFKASQDTILVTSYLQLIQPSFMRISLSPRPAYETPHRSKATTPARPQPFGYSSGPYL